MDAVPMSITQNRKNRIPYISKNTLFVVFFGIVYLLLNYTAFIHFGGVQGLLNTGVSRLDASWIIGLNWASNLHLRWDADSLVFTYGPLYYLGGHLLPEFHHYRTLLIVHVGMNLLFASWFAYVFSFFSELFGTKKRWLLVVAVLLLMQKPDILLLPLFVAFISLPIVFSNNEMITKEARIIRYARYSIISLILAFIPSVKFSHIYESILFVVVLVLFLSYRQKFFDAVLLCALFIIFSILIWTFSSGQDVISFLPYLQTRFILSSGYTEAMMIDFSQPTYFQIFILALSYLTVLGLVLLYLLSTRQISWITAWLLPLISLFLGFKSSFVRADEHAYIFLRYIFLSSLYYYYLIELNKPERMELPGKQTLVRTCLPFLAIIVCASCFFLGGKLNFKSEFSETLELIKAGPNAKPYNQNLSREVLQTTYHLDPEFLNQINRKKSIDIIPWDIALLYGYDLLWRPRPILQSYASYTSELDSLDADFFRKSGAPEQLIMSLSTIDQRYIVFDTPATFRTLLDRYKYISQSSDGRYALFRKKRESSFRKFTLISRNEYLFSEKILVPEERDGHVFLFAQVEPSLISEILNVFYKPTTLFIEVTLQNGEVKRNRFIRDMGKNGLFVSTYITDLNDLEAVFDETYEQNITSVLFLGDGRIYKEPFQVRFYKVPFE